MVSRDPSCSHSVKDVKTHSHIVDSDTSSCIHLDSNELFAGRHGVPDCAFFLEREARLFLCLGIIYFIHKTLGSSLQINTYSELLDVPLRLRGCASR